MAFKRCQRLHYFQHIQRLQPRTTPAGRAMGRMFGEALETGNLPEVVDVPTAQVHELAAGYLRRYPAPMTREIKFDHPVLGVGYLDGVLTDSPYIGIEDKLMHPAFWRDADERQLSIDEQVTAYFAAMRSEGTPLVAMQYRVTLKPAITQRLVRQPETLGEYRKRLRDQIQNEPGKHFKVYDLRRTDDQIDQFMLEVAEEQRQYRSAKRKGIFPRNTGSCTMYGGCAFLALCREEPGAIMNYEHRPARITPRGPLQDAIHRHLLSTPGSPVTSRSIGAELGLDSRAASSAARALVKLGLINTSTVEKPHTYWV